MFAYPTMVFKVLTVAAESRAHIGKILNILEAIDIKLLKRMLNLTILDNKIRGKDAVSYTHLDVYKRQVLCSVS